MNPTSRIDLLEGASVSRSRASKEFLSRSVRVLMAVSGRKGKKEKKEGELISSSFQTSSLFAFSRETMLFVLFFESAQLAQIEVKSLRLHPSCTEQLFFQTCQRPLWTPDVPRYRVLFLGSLSFITRKSITVTGAQKRIKIQQTKIRSRRIK